MPVPAQATVPTARPILNLRWWIGALLFASTVINYIDRQTLALLSPYLKQIYTGPTATARIYASDSE